MTPRPAAHDVPALLTALQASDPGRPRVTWYGPADGPGAGERIELSARVLLNWVAKTANLLAEELDAGPGSCVALDLPPHWKQLVWALAAWSVGAEVVTADDAPDVLVAARPDDRDAPALVVVALPSLARRYEPQPPAAWLDWAAEVAGFDDALPVPPGPLEHDELLAHARTAGRAEGVRLLVDAVPGTDRTQARRVAVTALEAFVADGSVVLAARPLTPGELASERVD